MLPFIFTFSVRFWLSSGSPHCFLVLHSNICNSVLVSSLVFAGSLCFRLHVFIPFLQGLADMGPAKHSGEASGPEI